MASPPTGQAIGTGLTTAVPLAAANVQCQAFTLKASATNTGSVYVGGSTVTNTSGFELAPGESFTYIRTVQQGGPVFQLEPSDLFMAGSTGNKVTWLASP